MEMSKIILTVKENMVGLKQVGVNEFKSYTSKSTSSKIAALEAFTTLMSGIDTNDKISDTVIHIFLPDIIYKPFVNGTIASYIRCKKTRNGQDLTGEEVKAYDLAYDMYLARAKNLVLRTSDFKALDKIKETAVKAEIKECYLKLEKALKKAQYQPQVIVQQAAAPAMSESTKKTIDMLNAKAQEALLAGDIDLMERLLNQASKLEANYVSAAQAPVSTTTETIDTTTIETTQEESIDTANVNGVELNITIEKGDENLPEGFAAFANAQ